MKKLVILPVLLGAIFVGAFLRSPNAAESISLQSYEYVTIRWSGRENTHLIRSSGKVEFLGPILSKIPRPDRTDDRAFYMNAAMNAAAKEGFEFAGMTHDEIVMKRPLAR
jgi:hypothetical protein